MSVKLERYCRKKLCQNTRISFFIIDDFLHGGHIGGHFEKKSSRRCSWSRADVVKKNCVKIREFNFLAATFFCMAAILAAILEKKVDEDAPGTEPMLHSENRVKIRCRLGGEGGRTHTHTGLRKVSRIYPQWTLTSHEWLCGKNSM